MFIHVSDVWWVNADAVAALRVETGINGIPQVIIHYLAGAPGAPTMFTGEDATLLVEALTPLLAARAVPGSNRVVADPNAQKGRRVEFQPGHVERFDQSPAS